MRPWWLLALVGCGGAEAPMDQVQRVALPAEVATHCTENIGSPRVEEVVDGVWLAIGYDLASTILIETEIGRVVVDAAMSPTRAREVRRALDEVTEGPIAAVIYTHSHIDHVGGASVWVEEGTEVWATTAFPDHFFKQYGTFLAAESQRGVRQFGMGVPSEDLPCSALGRTPDIAASTQQGVVLPTRTFTGRQELEFGSTRVVLQEAHGETHDQLFVWLPQDRVLLPGDNWYRAFPNLYTIRGSAPRDVDAWIDSLDAMRALEPEILIPSHTVPVLGSAEVQAELTAYRDAIQWVRDEVVRGANAGLPLDTLVGQIGLPTHLANTDALTERYGTVAWSVRAIYTNRLGWFDGQAAALMPTPDEGRRLVALAGGADKVAAEIRRAIADGETAWAVRLVAWLDQDGTLSDAERGALAAQAYRALAASQGNTNARGYLLAAANEREGVRFELKKPTLAGDFIKGIPLESLFAQMAGRLKPDQANLHESLAVEFEDSGRRVTLTVRHGVLETRWGPPLPGTPDPVAVLRTTEAGWRELALGERSNVAALVSGQLGIEGNPVAVMAFMDRFDRALVRPSEHPP